MVAAGGRSGHRSPQLSDFGISQSSLSSEARSRNPNPTVCLISAAKTIGEGIHDAYRGRMSRRGGERLWVEKRMSRRAQKRGEEKGGGEKR